MYFRRWIFDSESKVAINRSNQVQPVDNDGVTGDRYYDQIGTTCDQPALSNRVFDDARDRSVALLVNVQQKTALFRRLAAREAHPGPHPKHSREELAKRESAASKRHLQARACAADIAAFNAKRRAKRALARRALSEDSSASSTSSAAAPHYTELQNTTCILAPEVTEGPYYINNELVRQDLRETQDGISLVLDIGVMDVTTCTPMDDVFVEIWAANATGVYAGYAATLSGGGPTGTSDDPGDASGPSAMPSGTSAGGGGGMGGGMQSSPLERNETFGRGGFPTGSGGVVELTTIYPGFYEGRTAHIHTMIHMNYSTSANGTIVSHAGNILHIGQFFTEESWNDKVFAIEPYASNTNTRTYNDEDSILAQENADGNNAYLAIEMLGESVEDGLLGYITVGVNSSTSYSIMNTNYLNSTGADA
ncbi:hypothetical protein V5O48_005012 [Marasmius crinis-equi]|uniref:Intradiol ring-cleavage dioxygenases domain-containing protein n=1 Tax=Marasmius crinis-equi TaxID=585013 RepID=A0ABR3FNG2_9AGAR